MHLLIAYDIADNRRRNRLAKGLCGFLERVQFSVFEGEIPDQRLEKLLTLIDTEIDPVEDSVRIYRLCKRCELALEIKGLGEFAEAMGDEIV